MSLLSFSNKSTIWYIFSLLILSALIVRVIFFNGPFGSDDVVYLHRSLEISQGHWTSANYNGALRYGYNIPSGFLIYLFGLNIFTANLWSLLCSLIEIGAVFIFARQHINFKTAVISSLFLAFMPLHVAVSTRIHSDPVVSMFLTLSFVFFYNAEQKTSKPLYFLTGIFLGCVFWTKELAAVVFFALLLYPIAFQKIRKEWIYLVFGGVVMLLLHFLLMQFIAGDPLHTFKVVIGQLNQSFIHEHNGEDEPFYYFRYLFFDIKHTWVVPFIALCSMLTYKSSYGFINNNGIKYCLFWLISLLIILSFFPVSLNPLRFAMKQSNYISLFLAPISLIAGSVISTLPRRIAYACIIVTVSGGFFLSALEQQAYQVFTSNSRGLLAFSEDHPNRQIYASANNARIACFNKLLSGGNCSDMNVHEFKDAKVDIKRTPDEVVYAVMDKETMGWGGTDQNINKPPVCWKEIQRVIPADTGNSHRILNFLLRFSNSLPEKLLEKLKALEQPKAAYIYTVESSNLFCTPTNEK